MGGIVSSYLYNATPATVDASGNAVPPTPVDAPSVPPSADPSGNTVPAVDPSGNPAVDPSGNVPAPECNVVFEANTCRIEDAPALEPLVVPLSALVPVPIPMPAQVPAATTSTPPNTVFGSPSDSHSDMSTTPRNSPAEPNHMQKARKRPNKRR